MNDTPTTDAMVSSDQHHLEDDNFFSASVYWRMCDLARHIERELTATRAELSETQKDFMCLAELLDGHDATECRMNLVRLKGQRDEWKAKYIQQNKDLGCEMMDPNGTIWDYAKKVQLELTAMTEQRDEARRLAEKYRYLSCDSLDEADETLLPWETTKPEPK